MKIERGDHIIPNIGESFPVEAEVEFKRVLEIKLSISYKLTSKTQMEEKEKQEYYEEAARKGPGSRLTKDFFTVIGKMKVFYHLFSS